VADHPHPKQAIPVLCVEDDGPTLSLLSRILKGRFEQVLLAACGRSNLQPVDPPGPSRQGMT